MNYSAFIKILLILAIILTAAVCAIKPKMHSTLLITDSNYVLTSSETEPEKTKTNEVIATISQEEIQKPKVVEKPVSEPIQRKVETTVQPIQKTVVNTPKPVQQTQTVKTKPTVSTTTTKPVQKPVQQVEKVQTKPQTLTEQQEEIAWNKWRSNLQNQIMKDSKLPPIPNGTVFKFSFTVDKYGKVTNVKTWSLDSKYTPYAIQFIAPVIRGYQGHSILDFPFGSNRVITNVDGGFKISNTSKYSTPNDYNDTETVKR